MAKRRSVKKVPTVELQGEGSYVVVSAVKTKEIKQTRRLSQEAAKAQEAVDKLRKAGDEDVEDVESFDGFQAGLDMIQRHLVDWNWVDDNDVLLPKPKDHPEVVDELSTDEVTFLANLLTGEEESKN